MTTFIKAKLKKSDDQKNIEKCRVAANIREFHIISKVIFLKIIISKFVMIRQLLRTDLSAKGIIPISVKSIGQFGQRKELSVMI